MTTKRLSNKEKWLSRRLVMVVLFAGIIVIPFIALNEFYFMGMLGWQSVAFPVLLAVALFAVMLVKERFFDEKG